MRVILLSSCVRACVRDGECACVRMCVRMCVRVCAVVVIPISNTDFEKWYNGSRILFAETYCL